MCVYLFQCRGKLCWIKGGPALDREVSRDGSGLEGPGQREKVI